MTLEEIDTPALVLDLGAFERNLDAMAARARAAGVDLRPHAKAHKSLWIARSQIERGAIGLCCQKVSEAAIFVSAGFESILITNEVVGTAKIRAMAELAQRAEIAFCVDAAYGLEEYDELAAAFGVEFQVLIDLQGGWYRPGVATTEQVLDLAKRVMSFDHLRFNGLQAYNASSQHIEDFDVRTTATIEFCDRVREAVGGLTDAGIECSVVSGSGTGTYSIDPVHGPFTEIQPGSYVFMDAGYLNNRDATGQKGGDFEVSLFVLTTVMSRPSAGVAIVDCGVKGVSIGHGMPLVCDLSGASARHEFARASDDHGSIKLAEQGPPIGHRFLLVPYNVDPTVNLYDECITLRDGTVTGSFPISARGRVH